MTRSSEEFGLAERLHSASIRLLRLLRRQDAASGLSAPHLSALSVLVFGGPRRPGELAEAEGVRPPSMTRVVQKLERLGLLRREADPRDGRAARLHATERGAALLHEGRARRLAELDRRLERLSAEERETLQRAAELLGRILRSSPES